MFICFSFYFYDNIKDHNCIKTMSIIFHIKGYNIQHIHMMIARPPGLFSTFSTRKQADKQISVQDEDVFVKHSAYDGPLGVTGSR